MGVGIVPFSNLSAPAGSISYPNRVSLCFFDDGGGGQILLNGLGVDSGMVASALDLKSIFTSNSQPFVSYPLLSAFRRLSADTSLAAMLQLVKEVEISIVALSTAVTIEPSITYLSNLAVANVPFLQIAGPTVAGTWRIELKLRHSITN